MKCFALAAVATPGGFVSTPTPTPTPTTKTKTKTNGDFDCGGKVTQSCGSASEYVQCKGANLGCSVGTSEIRTQGCK